MTWKLIKVSLVSLDLLVVRMNQVIRREEFFNLSINKCYLRKEIMVFFNTEEEFVTYIYYSFFTQEVRVRRQVEP